MRISNWTWLVISACFISWWGLAARPSADWQLASIASCIAAFFSLVTLVIRGALKWRERGLVDLISCLLIVAACPAGVAIGRMVRGVVLSHDIDRYNAAAKWVAAHNRPDSSNLVHLPPQYGDLAYGVNYERDDVCGIMIDFYWGGGFPVKHIVRRYATNPGWVRVEKCHKDWERIHPVSDNWYEIAD